MKTFTPCKGFTATEDGKKVRYEADKSYELDDALADQYVKKGLGDAVAQSSGIPWMSGTEEG